MHRNRENRFAHSDDPPGRAMQKGDTIIMECRTGIVKYIDAEKLEVQIIRNSACSTCHAKGACTSQDVKEQLITITDFPLGLKEGDAVSIIADSSMDMKAILYAFVIPLIVLIALAIILGAYSVPEDIMVIALLGALAVYGGVLWLMRGYFTRIFSFRVEPKY